MMAQNFSCLFLILFTRHLIYVQCSETNNTNIFEEELLRKFSNLPNICTNCSSTKYASTLQRYFNPSLTPTQQEAAFEELFENTICSDGLYQCQRRLERLNTDYMVTIESDVRYLFNNHLPGISKNYNNGRLYFNLSQIEMIPSEIKPIKKAKPKTKINSISKTKPSKAKSVQAQLRISRNALHSPNRAAHPKGLFNVTVYYIERNTTATNSNLIKHPLDSVIYWQPFTGFLQFDITKALDYWRNSGENLGLVVGICYSTSGLLYRQPDDECETSTLQAGLTVTFEEEQWQWNRPYLTVFLQSNTTSSKRRKHRGMGLLDVPKNLTKAEIDLINRPSESKCHLRTLTAEWRDVQLSGTVLEPPVFHLNFCTGTCDSRTRTATRHGAMMNILRQSYGVELPAPCCVPGSLQSVAILYKDLHDYIVVMILPDVTATSCVYKSNKSQKVIWQNGGICLCASGHIPVLSRRAKPKLPI